MNLGPQTVLKLAVILPTLRKFYILLHCHASQRETELNQTLPNGRKQIALTICRKSWVVPVKNKGQ